MFFVEAPFGASAVKKPFLYPTMKGTYGKKGKLQLFRIIGKPYCNKGNKFQTPVIRFHRRIVEEAQK
jgi:hypothetical protein